MALSLSFDAPLCMPKGELITVDGMISVTFTIDGLIDGTLPVAFMIDGLIDGTLPVAFMIDGLIDGTFFAGS